MQKNGMPQIKALIVDKKRCGGKETRRVASDETPKRTA